MATLTTAELDARENLITKLDGDGKPLTVHMLTGVVGRYMYDYFATLKPEARLLFLSEVCIVEGREIAAFIKGCNRAAARKNLASDQDRRAAALQYAGIIPTPVKSAKPHKRGCTCHRCVAEHAKGGCRSLHCHTCGTRAW